MPAIINRPRDGWEQNHMNQMVERAVKAEQQRDELLRMLWHVYVNWDGEPEDMVEARALIAKIEEDK